MHSMHLAPPSGSAHAEMSVRRMVRREHLLRPAPPHASPACAHAWVRQRGVSYILAPPGTCHEHAAPGSWWRLVSQPSRLVGLTPRSTLVPCLSSDARVTSRSRPLSTGEQAETSARLQRVNDLRASRA